MDAFWVSNLPQQMEPPKNMGALKMAKNGIEASCFGNPSIFPFHLKLGVPGNIAHDQNDVLFRVHSTCLIFWIGRFSRASC